VHIRTIHPLEAAREGAWAHGQRTSRHRGARPLVQRVVAAADARAGGLTSSHRGARSSRRRLMRIRPGWMPRPARWWHTSAKRSSTCWRGSVWAPSRNSPSSRRTAGT